MNKSDDRAGRGASGRRFDAILFDADGTLLDFERAERHALEAAFGDVERPYRSEYLPYYEEINREMWTLFEQGRISAARLRIERFERFCERIGIDVEPELMSGRFVLRLSEGGFLIDHALDVVRRLAPGRKLALVTNGLSEVQRSRFARSGLDAYIDVLVISEEVGSPKPEPAMFEHAFERLGHRDRSTALMVGDSLSSDIQGGVNFGIATCWFRRNGAPPPSAPTPDFTITDLRELIAICDPTGAR